MTATPPTVLSIHSRYRERGGEDQVFEAEAELLERHGWRVFRWTAEAPAPSGGLERLKLARDTFWSPDQRRRLGALLAAEQVDVVHVHNTFPRISPAVIGACRAAGVPVVHTLHNYRLLCAAGIFLRDGAPCEDCVGRALPWPAVVHRCYHSSLPRTSVLAGATVLHRALGVWAGGIDLWIAPSEFTRGRFVAAGFAAERLAVKPNFVDPDPGVRPDAGRHALYVGRLSKEKGVATMMRAWRRLDIPLKVAGSGPMTDEVEELARRHPSAAIECLGRVSRAEVFRLLHGARFLVFPSEWYECCPLAILEAFACGVPVVSSALGAAAELVGGGERGWTFTAGAAAELAGACRRAWDDIDAGVALGTRARRAFEERFSAEPAYRELLQIYGRFVHGAEPELTRRLAEASLAAG